MKGRIALFIHQPKCSIESGNGILEALQPYYKFKIFTKWRLDADFFDDVDMIAFPGGIGIAIVTTGSLKKTANEYVNLYKAAEST
jgi:hypothetical protein